MVFGSKVYGILLFLLGVSGACYAAERGAGAMTPPGPNAISGEAHLVRGDTARPCTGVELIADTDATTAWVRGAFHDDGSAPRRVLDAMPQGGDFQKNRQHAACDARGYFRFAHVPDGQYYVLASVRWAVRWQRNGGGLVKQVSVAGGQQESVSLAGPLR